MMCQVCSEVLQPSYRDFSFGPSPSVIRIHHHASFFMGGLLKVACFFAGLEFAIIAYTGVVICIGIRTLMLYTHLVDGLEVIHHD